jgi:hypothetical protein
MPEPVREYPFFTDDAAVISNMLRDQWSLGPEQTPNIMYVPETYVVNARVGAIYVYVTSVSNNISSMDYRTIDREARVNIKVSTRFRDTHFLWNDEVYRILLSNRRIGRRHQVGASFLKVNNYHTLQNESGWYTTIFEVVLTYHNMAIRSAGFGDKINRQIEDNNHIRE